MDEKAKFPTTVVRYSETLIVSSVASTQADLSCEYPVLLWIHFALFVLCSDCPGQQNQVDTKRLKIFISEWVFILWVQIMFFHAQYPVVLILLSRWAFLCSSVSQLYHLTTDCKREWVENFSLEPEIYIICDKIDGHCKLYNKGFTHFLVKFWQKRTVCQNVAWFTVMARKPRLSDFNFAFTPHNLIRHLVNLYPIKLQIVSSKERKKLLDCSV